MGKTARRAKRWVRRSCWLLALGACSSGNDGGAPTAGGQAGQAGETDSNAHAGARDGQAGVDTGGANAGQGVSGENAAGASGEPSLGAGATGASGGEGSGAIGGEAGSATHGGCVPLAPPAAKPIANWDGVMPAGICTPKHACQVAPLPGHFTINDLWASSANDVWLVGELGSIVHFDGVDWTGIRGIGESESAGTPGASFLRVHGSSPSDVWVLGPSNQLLHFDGSRWSTVIYDGKVTASAIWAQGPCDVWIFGDVGLASHFDGTSWKDVQTPTIEYLYDAVGFDSGHVWAVGGNAVVHFDGMAWHDDSGGLAPFANLHSVWGASEDDLWAVGAVKQFRKQGPLQPWQQATVLVDGAIRSAFTDVNGSAADDVLLAPGAHFNGSGFDAASIGHKVWSTGKGDYFSADPPDNVGHVRVSHQATPVVEFNQEPFGANWAADPDTLYRLRPLTAIGPAVLERRSNGAYVLEDTTLAWPALLSGSSASDVWAVDANNCDTSHFNGTTWTKYLAGPTGANNRATRVALSPDGNAWIACGNRLRHFEGNAWALKYTFTDKVSEIAAGNDKVWVVTLSSPQLTPQLFEFAAGSAGAIPLPFPTPGHWPALAGADNSGRLWAAEQSNNVSYWLNGSWHSLPYQPSGVDVRGDEVWFIANATTYRVDGVAVVPYDRPCGYYPDVLIAGPGEIWFSGSVGTCRLREAR